MNVFLLRSETRQRYLLPTLVQYRAKEIKVFLFADNMIVFVENPKEFPKSPRINELSKDTDTK